MKKKHRLLDFYHFDSYPFRNGYSFKHQTIPRFRGPYRNPSGYPSYILPFLGVAKLLGVIAILVPGFPKIKEWAYAGLTFDLAGATYSSIAVGDPVKNWIFFLLFFILIAGSYYFYHKKLSQA